MEKIPNTKGSSSQGSESSTMAPGPEQIKELLASCDINRMPSEGSRLGAYVLLEVVGKGAFATVWRAEHCAAHTIAAIKVFLPKEFSPDDRFNAAIRFCEGATAMRRLYAEPHIVKIHEGPAINDGFLWFSMEFIEGKDLGKRLSEGPLSPPERSAVIRTLIQATAVAHGKGIVHRDIRPANILLRKGPGSAVEAVLTDFDIAYYDHIFRNRESTAMSPNFGVARYLPPDVLQSAGPILKANLRRPSNDLFAICVVIFELYCGADSTITISRRELAALLRKEEALMPREERPDVNTGPLIDLLTKGLAHAESARFRRAVDLEQAWEQVVRKNRFYQKALSLAFLLNAVSLLVLGDYLTGRAKTNLAGRLVIEGLLGGGMLLSSVFLFAHRHLNLQIVAGVQRILRIVEFRPRSTWLITLALFLLAIDVAPRWIGMFSSYGIVDGKGCFMHSTAVPRRDVERNEFDWLELPGENRQLKCERSVRPLIYQSSLIQPRLNLVELERIPQLVADKLSVDNGRNGAQSDLLAYSLHGVTLDSWPAIPESDMRHRLLRSIRNDEGLAHLVRNDLEEALPATSAPVALGEVKGEDDAFDSEMQKAVLNLRRKANKMGEGPQEENRAVRLAIMGHLAALVADCLGAANNYGAAFEEDPSKIPDKLYRVWAMDAARCLSRGGADDVVVNVTAKSPTATREVAGLVLWVIRNPKEWKRGGEFLRHGVRLLISKQAEWDMDRRTFVNIALGKSYDCHAVLLALEILGRSGPQEGVKEKLRLLMGQMGRQWQGRGWALRDCTRLPEQLESVIAKEVLLGNLEVTDLDRARALIERKPVPRPSDRRKASTASTAGSALSK